METKNRKPRRAFVAVVLTLALAGIGATIAPPQAGDSAVSWDAAPHLAAAVLPNVAFADSLDQQRQKPHLTSCAKREGGFFRRLWDSFTNGVKRVIAWVSTNCQIEVEYSSTGTKKVTLRC